MSTVREASAAGEADGMIARHVPPLLRDTVFRRFWTGSTISLFGDQVSSIAVPLTAVLALHVLTLWQLYAVVFAAGTLSIVFNVADSTLFVSIVEPSMYVDGQSLLNGSRAMSYVAGPSAGGLLAQLLGAPLAIIADALSFLGSAFFLARIRPAEPPASGGKGGVTAGLRFIARSPIVRASLIGVAVVNLFNLMFNALFTLYAIRTLHVSPGLLGVVLGCGALGGVLGSVLTKRIARRVGAGMAYVASAFCFTAPFALVPLAPVPHGQSAAGLGLPAGS